MRIYKRIAAKFEAVIFDCYLFAEKHVPVQRSSDHRSLVLRSSHMARKYYLPTPSRPPTQHVAGKCGNNDPRTNRDKGGR